MATEGTSGSYFLYESGDKVAVFKPIDEEPCAPNNPRDNQGLFGGSSVRNGLRSGELTVREVVAYLLDKDGFSGVPATCMVNLFHQNFAAQSFTSKDVVEEEDTDFVHYIRKLLPFKNLIQEHDQLKFNSTEDNYYQCADNGSEASTAASFMPTIHKATCLNANYIPKVGSLQSFVRAEGPIEDYSSSLFSLDEVHKIAVLDMRILNLDRNACNILVQRTESGYNLVPIDHGLSLPDTLEVCTYDLAWLSFEQSELPFSKKTLNYI